MKKILRQYSYVHLRAVSQALMVLLQLSTLLSLIILSGCKEELELHTSLSEVDANQVVAALVENQIHASKRASKEGVSVLIDADDIALAVKVLNDRGLPRKSRASMGEVFQKEGIISSPLEERARYIYALSQELEYTFTQIQGVIVSRVHVVLPEKVAPGEPIQPSSAAVFIKHQDSLDPDVALPKIRRMVASSIPGLADAGDESIAVVFMPVNSNYSSLKSNMLLEFEKQASDSLASSTKKNETWQTKYGMNVFIAAVMLLIFILFTLGKNKFQSILLAQKQNRTAAAKEK